MDTVRVEIDLTVQPPDEFTVEIEESNLALSLQTPQAIVVPVIEENVSVVNIEQATPIKDISVGTFSTTAIENVNTEGIGVYLGKQAGVNQFAGIQAEDSRLSVDYNSTNKTISVGVNIPTIISSSGTPPDPSDLEEGTIFIQYT